MQKLEKILKRKHVDDPEVIERVETLTRQQRDALAAMLSNRNVFLHGQGGTGKSYLIQTLRMIADSMGLRYQVCAPTGIAAINVRGVTIHRLLKAGPHSFTDPDFKPYKLIHEDSVLNETDIVIIDEISMCSALMMDCLAECIEYVNNMRRQQKSDRPPIRIMVIGDFYQLPPVIIPSEIGNAIRQRYHRRVDKNNEFAFQSHAWPRLHFKGFELTTVKRQKDPELIRHLSALRKGDQSVAEWFEEHVTHGFDDEAITLSGQKTWVNAENETKLRALAAATHHEIKSLRGHKEGNFPVDSHIVQKDLRLCVGAKVMVCYNGTYVNKLTHEKVDYVNGSMGHVTGIDKTYIDHQMVNRVSVRLNDGHMIRLTPVTWEQIEYVFDWAEDDPKHERPKQWQKRVVSSFTQVPLTLGWALTVHKAQGITLDKVNINLDDDMFRQCPALFYVAMSRCTTVEGVHIGSDQHVTPGVILAPTHIEPYLRQMLGSDGRQRTTIATDMRPNEGDYAWLYTIAKGLSQSAYGMKTPPKFRLGYTSTGEPALYADAAFGYESMAQVCLGKISEEHVALLDSLRLPVHVIPVIDVAPIYQVEDASLASAVGAKVTIEIPNAENADEDASKDHTDAQAAA